MVKFALFDGNSSYFDVAKDGTLFPWPTFQDAEMPMTDMAYLRNVENQDEFPYTLRILIKDEKGIFEMGYLIT